MTTVICLPDQTRPAHSPLGASGAERWMKCPGSVALLKNLELDESDEPDYRREGLAMHEAAAHCLDNALDAWELVGQTFHDTEITDELALPIQTYLDYVGPIRRQAEDTGGESWVEHAVSSPVHPDFYGTMDFGALLRAMVEAARVKVVDLKGGEGIIVEPDHNPQMKYYAFGLIDAHPEWDDDMEVDLTIVQPRAFHVDGPVREWTTTVGEIRQWVDKVLVPAMNATAFDHTLDAGPWCRFCPAKLVCPLLTSLFRAACVANPKEVVLLNDESIGYNYQYVRAVSFYLKALGDEVYNRLNRGKVVPGAKLVPKRSNRVFKPGAADLARQRFGEDAFSKPELKSPPQIELLGPAAKTWVKEFAYSPATGLTVANEDDPRPAVVVKSMAETFGAAVAALRGDAT